MRGTRCSIYVWVVLTGIFAVAPIWGQGTNLALQAKATADSEFPGGGFEASRAIDGKDTTRWNDNCQGGDHWLALEWPSPQTIGKVVIKQAFDRIKSYKIQSWDEAKNDWVDVFQGTGPGSGRIDINQTLTADLAPPVITKKIRLWISNLACASIWELEVFAPPKLNLALFAKASADSEFPGGGFEASRAIDGKDTTRWNDNCQGGEHWIALEWPSPQTFNKVIIKQAFDRIGLFHLQTWDATKNDWVNVFEGRGPASGRIDINQTLVAVLDPPATSTRLRLHIPQIACASIWELEVFNVPFGTVFGKVTDEGGQPVAGAQVVAGDASTVTDQQGNYTLVVDPGLNNITVSKTGEFKSRTARGVEVPEKGRVERNFVLFRQPPNLVKGATVQASSESAQTDPDTGNPLYPASFAADGDLKTRWMAGGTDNEYLDLIWEKPQTFNRVTIREFGDAITEYKLQRFDEGKGDFVDIATRKVVQKGGDAILTTTLADPVTTKQLRILISGFVSPGGGLPAPSIMEVEVQNTPVGTVKGRVIDVFTGNPVPNADVIADPGGAIGVTDSAGTFTAILDPDDFALTAKKEGFFPGEPVIVTVEPGKVVEVEVPIPAKGENLARKAQAEASSEDGDNTADKAIDGQLETFWGSAGTEEGFIGGQVTNAWIQLTWPQPITFNRLILHEFGDRSREISFQAWDDQKKDWVEFASAASPGGGADIEIVHEKILSSPVTTKQVRIFVPTGQAPPRFREIEIYNFVLPPKVTPPAVKKGDLNADGKVTLADVILALQVAVGLKQPTKEQLSAGDLNNNGKIELPEVITILQVAVGKRTL